jgi:hypothetical protein
MVHRVVGSVDEGGDFGRAVAEREPARWIWWDSSILGIPPLSPTKTNEVRELS